MTIKLWIFELVYVPNFSINWKFWFFGQNLPQKIHLVKTRKKRTSYEFCIFEISRFQTSASRIKFVPKGYPVKNTKSEQHHWFLHIQIIVDTKFQFKLTILIFFDQICPTKYLQSKTEKVTITNKFCIYELVLIPNFSLNWQFWFYGQFWFYVAWFDSNQAICQISV